MKAAHKQPLRSVRIRLEAEPFPIEQTKIRSLVKGVLTRFGVSEAEIDIRIVSDTEMQEMHRQYFQDRRTTDVISFDLTEPNEPRRCFQILVNAALALREAARRGHSPQAELSLYIVHGLLHNLGFDDGTPRQAERMHRAEADVLTSFGYPPVYYSSPRKRTLRRCRCE
ncbi:MAG TPA: rRNA maturation RNase YbeY [Anaerohalosphaeraceae bacterium]|nr:rRNA maturation RNase YbeY [Anaerohalosphaeraceae bacterium]HOL88787.1 rRNA maturation RNase YbeY [Anaerohalosphaeraceae bacterium]HPP55972.1 rRNA maturation RNase YbeY [Anaerohalosphaeraceae bacterium]